MKYIIQDKTDLEILELFIQTDHPIYVFNLLLKYFYYNLSISTKKYSYIFKYNNETLNELLEYYKNNYETFKKIDHTFYYSLDIESNIELFRHFLKYPWEKWDNGTILEVGSGFGIYTYLFNLFKDYYNLTNLKIISYDFSKYKIKKLKKIGAILQWTNNEYNIADATKTETFESLKTDNIKLIYSETFSSLGYDRENYNRIISNIKKCKLKGIIFPKDFIIKENLITHVKINDHYQSLSGFEIDLESIKIKKYIELKFKGYFGFRWGWW